MVRCPSWSVAISRASGVYFTSVRIQYSTVQEGGMECERGGAMPLLVSGNFSGLGGIFSNIVWYGMVWRAVRCPSWSVAGDMETTT